MGVLQNDIAAFERMRKELAAGHLKEWVVFYRGQFEGVFSDFESARNPRSTASTPGRTSSARLAPGRSTWAAD
jgi:hypothetical protein